MGLPPDCPQICIGEYVFNSLGVFCHRPSSPVGVYFTLVAYGLSPYASKMREALEMWLMGAVLFLLGMTFYVVGWCR